MSSGELWPCRRGKPFPSYVKKHMFSLDFFILLLAASVLIDLTLASCLLIARLIKFSCLFAQISCSLGGDIPPLFTCHAFQNRIYCTVLLSFPLWTTSFSTPLCRRLSFLLLQFPNKGQGMWFWAPAFFLPGTLSCPLSSHGFLPIPFKWHFLKEALPKYSILSSLLSQLPNFRYPKSDPTNVFTYFITFMILWK